MGARLGRQKRERRFEVIQALTKSPSVYGVHEACRTLGVSPSGFYAHGHKPQRLRRREDGVLADALKSAFDDSRKTYGSPRLVRQLRN